MEAGLAAALPENHQEVIDKMMNEIKAAHSAYRCQRHIVLAAKYRRKVIHGQLKKDVRALSKKTV